MTSNAWYLLLLAVGLLTGHLIGTLTPPEHIEGVAIGALCLGCFVLGMQVENIRVQRAIRLTSTGTKGNEGS